MVAPHKMVADPQDGGQSSFFNIMDMAAMIRFCKRQLLVIKYGGKNFILRLADEFRRTIIM